MPDFVAYQLPDRRIVLVNYDACREASTIDYELADGRIVLAVIADVTLTDIELAEVA